MRQFFTLRFWLSLAALGGLALGALAIARSRESAAEEVDVVTAEDRTIDLVSWVFAIQPPPDFEMVNGRASTDLALVLDGYRTMIVKAGTPGEVDCPRLTELAQCTVAADLLGDGVLWFSIVPGTPGSTVELPAVVELMSGGWVRLANGWVVQHAPVVARSCPESTVSLTEFINTFGDASKSTFNFEQQRIVKVTCPREPVATTAPTSIAPSEITLDLLPTETTGD